MKVVAHATGSGDWWAVEVPEVEGLFTQAQEVDDIPAAVADAVALLVDNVGADMVEVYVVIRSGSD